MYTKILHFIYVCVTYHAYVKTSSSVDTAVTGNDFLWDGELVATESSPQTSPLSPELLQPLSTLVPTQTYSAPPPHQSQILEALVKIK